MVVRLPPLTAHRSPFAVRRSPFAVRRSPFIMRRAPLPAYRSLSAIPFACRFRLPLLTPGPLPLAPSPFYSLPFTFTLRPRPVSRFQPSAGSPPFGQRRAPARARRPGATTARAGHDARRPSAFGALTNPRKTCPLRMPRDHACKHGKEAQCMNRSHSMPAWPGGRPRQQHARPARQAPRRRHAAATQRARLRRRQAACRRQRAMTSPACASPTARRPIRREHPRGLQHRDANAHRHGRIEACFIGARLGSRMPPPRGRTGPRPRQSAGVGRSCASLAASSPSPSLSSSASRRAGSPLVSRSVRARSASSR
ncbi:hydrolase, NUDIX family domain protein [Burkholderia pseudomallei BDU 2]|nr:hydrolase, NUDIX family domain protein [Burkholderia pseudomallei BDU 2]